MNKHEFHKLINELSSYSLINDDKEHNVYSIHPLVHAWARDCMASKDHACRVYSLILYKNWIESCFLAARAGRRRGLERLM